MKYKYLNVMERALDAYSPDHIDRYFEGVRNEGLREHGFARLVSNIGTMIAHGRKIELRSRFIDMMSFCCERVSVDRAANDFSIQEMIACIDLLEEKDAIDKEIIAEWRKQLEKPIIYNEVAKSADQLAYNWVLFSSTSEFLRMKRGLCPLDIDFIDMQLATQVVHLDENYMYRDANIHPPMVYDNVPRTLFSILLYYGYDGKYRETIEKCLRRAGILSLKMQSVSGEVAYGGRSNQFYHNESHLAAIFEFEATRCKKEGDLALAARFKRGAYEALSSIERGFAMTPIHHVKNRFPTETEYGCEEYAYFDKYMITVASFLNWARMFCDESIEMDKEPLSDADAFALSDDFHKLFLRCGDYFAEIDTNADPHYDASGIGRIHKRGAPGEIAISCPGTSTPSYKIDLEDAIDFAISAGIVKDGKAIFKTSGEYNVISYCADRGSAKAMLSCTIDGHEVELSLDVSKKGAEIKVRGEGKVAVMLPAFDFDGEEHTEITALEDSVKIAYRGYVCNYSTNGKIVDSGKKGCNRNGHYNIFYACRDSEVNVCVFIDKA